MNTNVLNNEVNQKVTTGYFRLKGDTFHEDKLVINRHQLSQDEKVSYPTLLRYLSGKEEVTNFNGDVLWAILVSGLGKTPEQVAEMKVGEIFELIPRKSSR